MKPETRAEKMLLDAVAQILSELRAIRTALESKSSDMGVRPPITDPRTFREKDRRR